MSSYDEAENGGGGGYVPPLAVLADRVRGLSRSMGDLMKWRGEVDVERERLRGDATNLAMEMKDLKKAVDTLRKTILGFALTVAGAAIVFALTVLSSSGKLP